MGVCVCGAVGSYLVGLGTQILTKEGATKEFKQVV